MHLSRESLDGGEDMRGRPDRVYVVHVTPRSAALITERAVKRHHLRVNAGGNGGGGGREPGLS